MNRAPYKIFYKASVEKDLRAIGKVDRIKIVGMIQSLAENPYGESTVKLSGPQSLYRIRQGDYRIVYAIQDRELIVLVIKIGHRRDIYRDVSRS